MKPGDHPEFYRLAPPGSATRESSILLNGEGRFYHEGGRVEHQGIHRAFASWIRRHPDDGRFILSNEYDWCYFTVEVVPYFVSDVAPADDGVLRATLFDGTEEAFDPRSLVVDDDGFLRVRVKGGTFEARLLRRAQLALEPLLDEDEAGGVVLVWDSARYPIRAQAPIPQLG